MNPEISVKGRIAVQILFFLTISLLSTPSFAAITFVSQSPQNLTAKITDQPSFTFTAQSNTSTSFSCTLWIDSSAYGTNSSVANNTPTTIQANSSLAAGSHSWWINCTDSDGEYKSSVYTIYTGGEIDNCAKLVDSYGHYVLTADIINSSTSPCIDIQADNIVFDCQNHLIDGDDNADYGIYIVGKTNVTVRNCRVG